MDFGDLEARGLVLLGCGKMGGAMLRGWLDGGLSPDAVTIIDPAPADWLREAGVCLNAELPASPSIVILAVKPQMMGEALPQVRDIAGGDTVFLSIAAGITIGALKAALGETTPVIRAMPNTPAAVGRGITALIASPSVTEERLAQAETLLGAVGQTVRLDREEQMDAVTAVSGSGPAYVFHLIETLAAAGEAEGLDPAISMALAKATVAGAGMLAENSEETPSQLRVNVTSPNGTTQAGLEVLMDETDGLPSLMRKTVAAAADRSRELGR